MIAEHCREIGLADGIGVVRPDWWGMPPAILKGWVDRVLRPGIAYRFADKTGFYYHTGTPKKVCGQLKKNPKVELCFYKPGEGAGTMMRVAGKAEFLKTRPLRSGSTVTGRG